MDTQAPEDVGGSAVDRLDLIHLPIVYLDWNVLQYLYRDETAGPLLTAVLAEVDDGNILAPYSPAHVFDAVAGWEHLSSGMRESAHRSMTFADGVTGAKEWSIKGGRHLLTGRPMRSVASELGLFAPRSNAAHLG